MNKKIMAVAVAGALAAPGLALAQASVTISGFVKVAVGQISNSGASTTAAGVAPRAGLNSSESRLQDDGPTRIEFDMRDQIDSNLAGIAKLSLRPTIDGNSAVNAGGAGAGFGSSSGTAYVGLESKDMGTLRLGSIDQHYILSVDLGAAYAPTEVASGLMSYSYIAQPVAGVSKQGTTQTSHTGASRTRNLVRWDSPNWSGFRVGVGYSFNTASGQESDMTTGGRKGNGLNINPSYTADTWRVIYSYYDDKRDAGGAATANNYKLQRLLGDVKLGDFTIGAAWDSAKADTITMATGTSVALAKRTAWQLTGRYQTGKHMVGGQYSKAGKDSVLVGDTGAKSYSLWYAYLFSARTSVGVGYSVLKNDALGTYTLSGEAPGLAGANVQNGYSSGSADSFAGEKQTFIGVSLRQAF
jgi:predicted porin